MDAWIGQHTQDEMHAMTSTERRTLLGVPPGRVRTDESSPDDIDVFQLFMSGKRHSTSRGRGPGGWDFGMFESRVD
nr:hypothetical protein CFP56_48689 [Quercus suber]